LGVGHNYINISIAIEVPDSRNADGTACAGAMIN
jgi:hypothetical protein